jgi:hypothetical protein
LSKHYQLSFCYFFSGCKGLLLDANTFVGDDLIVIEEAEPVLASPEDIAQVQRNPLVRARTCIEFALQSEAKLNNVQLMSSRLGLAYIYLAFGNHQRAIDMCQIVFGMSEPLEEIDSIATRLYRRQIATARLYAAEAACALGQPRKSLLFLTGASGNCDDCDVNGLAISLSGVSIELVSTNEKARQLFEKAQTIVQSSTIALASNDCDSNAQAAKELADKVQSEDDWYPMDSEKSSACLVLVYSMLRAGEQSSALALLMSMRSL